MIDYSRLKREILSISGYRSIFSQPACNIQEQGTYDRSRLEKEYERRFSGLIEKVTLKTDFPETE